MFKIAFRSFFKDLLLTENVNVLYQLRQLIKYS